MCVIAAAKSKSVTCVLNEYTVYRLEADTATPPPNACGYTIGTLSLGSADWNLRPLESRTREYFRMPTAQSVVYLKRFEFASLVF
jgi:hypothetical protein